MTALLLSPHHDDAELFACFQCLRHRPRVIVCTTPKLQEQFGVDAAERESETGAAMEILGCQWEQLTFFDTEENLFEPLRDWLRLDIDWSGKPATVIAPSYEDGGQPQHNAVAQAATEVFGDNIIRYLTYTRYGGRSMNGTLVEPDEPEWIALKLQALACYRSQLRVPNCRPWFYDQLDLREFLG